MIHACGMCVSARYPLWVTLPSHPKCVEASTRPAKGLDAIDAFGGEREISAAFGQGPQSVFECSLVRLTLGKDLADPKDLRYDIDIEQMI